MYNKIYDFCKVRNIGGTYSNSNEPTPRVQFLMQLLESEGMDYELDTYQSRGNTCYNLILKGDSDKMVVAHHDIVNPNIDNANDNSASVINAIMIKKLMPEMNVVLLDGEECGGLGSQRVSDQINDGYFNTIDWVLNLELTGKGGKYFFIGNYPGRLSDHIKSIFDCPITNTPYNDSVTFRKNGIDSVVINPIPPLNEGKSSVKWNDDTYLDFSMLYNCHSSKDTISTISVDDMKEFVEDVVLKILA
jgi:Peptidase family M28